MKHTLYASIKTIGLLVFFQFSEQLQAQELISTKYLDKFWVEVDSAEALYISRDYTEPTSKRINTIVSYQDGSVYSETKYSDPVSKVKDGAHRVYFKDGSTKVTAFYRMGRLHGDLETYYSGGQIRRKDRYDEGKLIDGKCYTSSGSDTTWFEYELSAEFPGGIDMLYQYVSQKVKYPNKAKEANIQGKVLVKFVVDQQGNIADAMVIKSAHPLLDEEALRVVNAMPTWVPGKIEGEPVKYTFSLPVMFRLE